MKFKLTNSSRKDCGEVEIATVEDLQKLSEQEGGFDLVLQFNKEKPSAIIIYDGWLE